MIQPLEARLSPLPRTVGHDLSSEKLHPSQNAAPLAPHPRVRGDVFA